MISIVCRTFQLEGIVTHFVSFWATTFHHTNMQIMWLTISMLCPGLHWQSRFQFFERHKKHQWKLLEKWQVYFFLSNGNVSRNFVGLKTTHEFLAMNGKLAWVFFSSSICGNFVKVHSPSELEKWSVKIICFSLKITTKKNPGKSSKNQEDFKWLRLGHLPQRVPFGTWWKEFPRRQRNFESLQISREFYEF